jgi:DNA-binding transcriptional MerR regulator
MVQSQAQWLKIGAVARLSEVSIDTVRYYERRGLIGPARRLPSGYRLYDEPTVARIRLARHLQSLGMTLEEIADALRAHGHGTQSCESERWRLAAVRDRVDAQLAELTTLRESIESALALCAAGQCELTAG